MKRKKLCLFATLMAVLHLVPAGQATAQTFTTLHSLSGGGGATPFAGLVSSSNRLYGTTVGIGENGRAYGTVFAIGADGTSFTNLHHLGNGPFGVMTLSGNTLYGTAIGGTQPFLGTSTVFSARIDGTGLTNLHTFTGVPSYAPFINADGGHPRAGLVLSGATLFGTTYVGGSAGQGTVFAVNTNGTSFTVLHHFRSSSGGGAHPQAGLLLSGSTLYGTTTSGGSSANGTVFALRTNGTGFTTLHSFPATSGSYPATNSGGANPQAGLVLVGDTLYGTAYNGGSSGNGTVFAVRTNGTGFKTLHHFAALNSTTFTNSEGANPNWTLVLSGGTLYGTTSSGGNSGRGTLFALGTNGTGFTVLHSFTGGRDGGLPTGLTLTGTSLYGTTTYGGDSDQGTVFKLSFQPQLTIARSGTNVLLSWPTNVSGFDFSAYSLQSNTNATSATAWSTLSAVPVISGGRNTVTNAISGTARFYRLAQ